MIGLIEIIFLLSTEVFNVSVEENGVLFRIPRQVYYSITIAPVRLPYTEVSQTNVVNF